MVGSTDRRRPQAPHSDRDSAAVLARTTVPRCVALLRGTCPLRALAVPFTIIPHRHLCSRGRRDDRSLEGARPTARAARRTDHGCAAVLARTTAPRCVALLPWEEGTYLVEHAIDRWPADQRARPLAWIDDRIAQEGPRPWSASGDWLDAMTDRDELDPARAT